MRLQCFLFLCLMTLISGCSSETTTDVSGTVTLDNQPLAEGTIVFEAEDGKGSGSSKIQNGKYSLKVAPGKKKVRITATRASSKTDTVMGATGMESIVPTAYNAQSRLTADVQVGKSNTFDYPLKSKP